MKQPATDFVVGDRIRNTQQISHYYGKVGVVVAADARHVRVRYDDGSEERMVGTRVWLEKQLTA